MKGEHRVTVMNSRLVYDFTIKRNLTVLKGDSATGKTTLIEMIRAYSVSGKNSGVTLNCDVNCIALEESLWKLQIQNTHGSIIFIDEGIEETCSADFAALIQNSDNYYVIASRSSMPCLPYSITEVYGIQNAERKRYGNLKPLYNRFYPIYKNINANQDFKVECVIVEDSNSGYDFFRQLCTEKGIDCIAASGNSAIFSLIKSLDYSSYLVIADGAAFGPHIEKILGLKTVKNLAVLLPESFEWLILKADLLNDGETRDILQNPSEHIESSKYFSWERFFTSLLIQKTDGTYLKYSKKKLNPSYLQKNESRRIIQQIKDIEENL